MNIIYLLLPLALVLAFVFVGFYLWANKQNQFEDLDTPPQRMLLDDSTPSNKKTDV